MDLLLLPVLVLMTTVLSTRSALVLGIAIGILGFLVGTFFLTGADSDYVAASLVAGALLSVLSARYMSDPRRFVWPFGLALMLFPIWLVSLGAQLGNAVLFLVGLALLLVGLVMLVRLGALDRSSPIELTPWLLVRSAEGLSASRDAPSRVILPFPEVPTKTIRGLCSSLRASRTAVLMWTRRERTVVLLGRIAGRQARYLYPWALLFGSTRISLEPGRAEIRIDARTYRLLGRPGPYREYCENLLSLIRGALETYEGRNGDMPRAAPA